MYKILTLNIGSTSTKLAYYEDETAVATENVQHPVAETRAFKSFMDQGEYRINCVYRFMEENNIKLEELDAITACGGHTKPVESGVYRVCPEMMEQQASGLYGRHPSDLGTKIAYSLAQTCKAIPLIVNPPITDEFEPVARLSGHPLFNRRSNFHVLSQKATAKRYAKENGLKYEDLNLIVVHMGGGISAAPHRKGRMIDGFDALEGDAPFSTNRTGYLPVGDLVKLCFSGNTPMRKCRRCSTEKAAWLPTLGKAMCVPCKKWRRRTKRPDCAWTPWCIRPAKPSAVSQFL